MRSTSYPLTLPALGIGVVVGALLALIADNQLVGFAFFVLVVTVGGTWRRGDVAVVPFIMAFQWIVVCVGYFYNLLTGIFPSMYPPGDVERTVSLSLLGLLVLATGIRVASWPRPDTDEGDEPDVQVNNLSGLFWLVMVIYAVDYAYVLNPKAFAGFDVILVRVLDFRQVLLTLLWFEIVRRQTGFRYLWITLAWVFVPLLGSYLSDFKMPLILLFIVYATSWTPWQSGWWHFSTRSTVRTMVVAMMLVFIALIWQAGVKKETRRAYDNDLVGRAPADRVRLFVSSALDNLPVVVNDTQTVVEGLVERISYVTFFSRVLDYVPKVHPHSNGELLQMALTNAFVPRFLFPDKPPLPSDSYYTRRFTGIPVAEEGTSISIGYMAEFYADWGVGGMMLMVFGYGCWIGLAYLALTRWVRPRILINPVLLTTMMMVYQFEHQFIKTFAALNLAVIVMLALVYVVRNPLERFLAFGPPPTDQVDAGEADAVGLDVVQRT